MNNLTEALPAEQARVREVLSNYEDAQRICGSRCNCMFAITNIKAALSRAEVAAAAGDVVAMLRAYAELKEIE